MLKFLVIGVALFLVYKLFMGDKAKREMDKAKVVKKKAASGEMIKDPICGTYVEKDGNIRVKEGDKVHVFCSYECRDKYLKQLEATTVNSDDS
ncbi:TRASH domain-containing protein [Pseudodesulfovibrio piezophilus]|uniref:TRASH domain-containing protein n=1 Tax=Pseudodesulfovibrio piezophilus (strain DSM 21447 / JCM 15486 / C1TLV30) TaxID=1322246 RepID=M1WQX3_PSEP2|nr:TRASH domain-containing protein [Pseudodesulfovibrio piezophilus]CCH47937.1 TRASH domain-containing protein [Pseudodesulfovibrio piezophilus C1TLV30]